MPDNWGSPGGSFSWEGIFLLPSLQSSTLSDVFPTCCFLPVVGRSLFSACHQIWMERYLALPSAEKGTSSPGQILLEMWIGLVHRADWNGSSAQAVLWFLLGNLGGYYACHTAEFLNAFFFLKSAFKCQYTHLWSLSIQNWQIFF